MTGDEGSGLEAEDSPLRDLREAAFEQRGRELGDRERELDELRRQLAERERELAERSRSVMEAELRVQRAGWRGAHISEQLARRAEELDRREAELAEREERLRRGGLTVEGDQDFGRYDLPTLERLVEESEGLYPDRRDDWLYYLLYLRDYAAADGRLPLSLDWLVDEVFAELVGGERADQA